MSPPGQSWTLEKVTQTLFFSVCIMIARLMTETHGGLPSDYFPLLVSSNSGQDRDENMSIAQHFNVFAV